MQQGILLVDLVSLSLHEKDKEILLNPMVAGVILFSRNYNNQKQLKQLTDEIYQIRSELLIVVDHEGGEVQRFRNEFIQLPAPEKIANYYQKDKQGALALAREVSWLMASELLAHGVDLSLAPVLDLSLGNPFIQKRSFGKDPQQVIDIANAWISGAKEAGMTSVLKHFPGHGSVMLDSHFDLPEDNRLKEEIFNRDMEPFRFFLQNKSVAFMPAHVVFSQVDNQPATYSYRWITQILRNELKFEGIVISDCLTMKAAASVGGYCQRAKQALAAGCQLLTVSNHEGVQDILQNLENSEHFGTDVSRLKAQEYIDYHQLVQSNRYQAAQKWINDLC